MLVSSHINSNCRHSIVSNGDCCCNCIYRYLLTTKDGFPIRYVCNIPPNPHRGEDGFILNLDYYGHGLCEMHQRISEPRDPSVLKIYTEL